MAPQNSQVGPRSSMIDFLNFRQGFSVAARLLRGLPCPPVIPGSAPVGGAAFSGEGIDQDRVAPRLRTEARRPARHHLRRCSSRSETLTLLVERGFQASPREQGRRSLGGCSPEAAPRSLRPHHPRPRILRPPVPSGLSRHQPAYTRRLDETELDYEALLVEDV
jgi:hypothetical protein